jgi:hypothetical protein
MGCRVARFGPSSFIGFLPTFVFLNFISLPMPVLAKWQMRSVRRYDVQAPVFFSWKDLEGGSQVGEGTTRDISTQAAFVLARNCPPQGNQLRTVLATTVSLTAAFACDLIDPSFRTPDEVVAFLGTPVLAALPKNGR